jgi:hypothetical protein
LLPLPSQDTNILVEAANTIRVLKIVFMIK